MSILEEKLIQMGLRPNEAKLYMTVLEQGKDTLMNIARKAKMSHPLAVRHFKRLVQEKLIFKVQEGKKNYYYIYNPRHGLRLFVRREMEKALKHQDIMDDYMEGFDIKYYGHTEMPEVKYLEGKHATRALHAEIDNTKVDELYEFTNLDEACKVVKQRERFAHQRELRMLKRKTTTIYTTEKGAILPPRWKRKKRYYIPKERFDFPGEISVFGDKVALIAFKPKYKVVIVREPAIAKAMKALFRLALEGTEKYPQPKRKTGRKKSSPMSQSIPLHSPEQKDTPSDFISS